jgi:hypothetical protein
MLLGKICLALKGQSIRRFYYNITFINLKSIYLYKYISYKVYILRDVYLISVENAPLILVYSISGRLAEA